MIWIVLVLFVGILALAVYARRDELSSMSREVDERARAKERGSATARLQYPQVDLSRCIGCGSCVDACPEEGVLGLVHGQAVVLHGARCVGHGRCAQACPVGAIAVTIHDLPKRRDIPALDDKLESRTTPGVFLAGEVTGFALVRTAFTHGIAVAEEVARRAKRSDVDLGDAARTLCIVGAGPAGIACALKARELGLDFVVIEQESSDSSIGGTVARYPRRKLVMTQPIELPLVGRLARTEYTKEELIELWERVAVEHELPVETGQEFIGLERAPNGAWDVVTRRSRFRARFVCLALGRRGTPRRLGVPGEELPKVAYSLLDAHSYQERRVLVVGGGDSAVEAALGLAEQPGNRVTLSYRKPHFFRLKTRNEKRLEEARVKGSLAVLFETDVESIEPDLVRLRREGDAESGTIDVANDDVFVMAGGVAPFEVLERAGVSFDPSLRVDAGGPSDRGVGLTRALLVALVCGCAVAAFVALQRDYYALDAASRAVHADHSRLRPSSALGLALGVAAAALVLANLSYLARRSVAALERLGPLRAWMTAHVATGLFALLAALLHAAFDPRATVGGYALWALVFLVVTGAIGRYLYAFVPRAANGRELELDEVKARVVDLAGAWDRSQRGFGREVEAEIARLVAARHWKGALPRRLLALLVGQRELARTIARLRSQARERGIAQDQIATLERLIREAHGAALAAAHFEDLRGLLASWRYFHRWVALLMVLLVVLHVVAAVRFGAVLGATP